MPHQFLPTGPNCKKNGARIGINAKVSGRTAANVIRVKECKRTALRNFKRKRSRGGGDTRSRARTDEKKREQTVHVERQRAGGKGQEHWWWRLSSCQFLAAMRRYPLRHPYAPPPPHEVTVETQKRSKGAGAISTSGFSRCRSVNVVMSPRSRPDKTTPGANASLEAARPPQSGHTDRSCLSTPYRASSATD